ncbi:hypothetical protein GGR88_001259 [Sphingomonas jejuensis]|uniref:Multidrug transporter n=1 Tax=Sphingomonas jejuensis TaxID=904715 RepID=A0ABX0XM66_9SPHN|nr:SapC family protein [Sphingomonas jejuensis]NJC33785.1 hypothetical protein [Sphingomonas jejuensis]
MASAPQQSLPLFYQDLVPLSSSQHKGWFNKQMDSAPFLSTQHAIPLTTDEFAMAQRFYPIIFSGGDGSVPLALMGLNEGVNTFVDENGRLTREAYVPAYIRRYPWMLAKLRPDTDELSLCFDPTAGAVAAEGPGDQLFDGDQPSEVTKQILQFCEQFEQAGQQTQLFMKELNESGLLMDGEVSIQQQGIEQPFIYRGFRMVDEQKLRDLRGDQLRKMSQNGMLPLLYAHLFSLGLMRDIFARQQELGRGPTVEQTSATIPAPANG